MSDRDQIKAFHADLTKLVERYCLEFDLSLAGAIGALQIKQYELWKHADAEINGEQES